MPEVGQLYLFSLVRRTHTRGCPSSSRSAAHKAPEAYPPPSGTKMAVELPTSKETGGDGTLTVSPSAGDTRGTSEMRPTGSPGASVGTGSGSISHQLTAVLQEAAAATAPQPIMTKLEASASCRECHE
ncbi:unnamed protein product [Ectocarpus sp. 12 AP-2014]